MRVAYVARHGCGGNDDEGAIAHAFRELGHEVKLIHEDDSRGAGRSGCDLLLFHKWQNLQELRLASGRMIRAFWWFDDVESDDSELEPRNYLRRTWMKRTMPHVDVGFMTDGDWADKHPRKLVTLRQGADERFVGFGPRKHVSWQLAFFGNPKGGRKRQSWHHEITNKYGGAYLNNRNGTHGLELRELVASTPICLAPDFPITDKYWSNRVYLLLGFGAFLLHPYCSELATQFQHGVHLFYYRTREEMHSLIAEFSERNLSRQIVQGQALEHVKRYHLYRHRVEDLLEWIRTHPVK